MTDIATSASAPFARPVKIDRATRADLPTMVEILATGFLDGDFADWLVPDPTERAEIYPDYFQILAEHAIDTGWVDITADRDAVAVWHDIPGHPATPAPIPDYARRLAQAVGTALPRFQALDTVMEAHHPAGPHHYLGHLAVRPHRRRQGLGSALLLHHHHHHLDQHGISAYLEATGPDNQRLYQRHGYKPHPPYPIADGAPPARPMWRKPSADTTG
ncbi:GNAT family N-acetyltransferase [Actinoplanes sp. NPDC051343]|uniref:GNAT family N-acetyltransferase n=1 Tax=Actinoplanes sp. NPDC051343 TaxID=3363906 RepID=UPI0037969387